MDEKLGQLEQSAALDGARVADELPCGTILGNPPFRRRTGKIGKVWLRSCPPIVSGAFQGQIALPRQVAYRVPLNADAGAAVVRGPTL